MDWGNVPDWISGLGGLFSVLFVAGTAVAERHRRITAENITAQVQHHHRAEIAQAAINQLTILADSVRSKPERALLSRITGGHVRAPEEVAQTTREAIGTLRALPQVEQTLHIALLVAEQACVIGELDGSTPISQMHAAAAARSRIQHAKEGLLKLI